ncbi:L-histidine N(alpha)-methyltransferase [Chryseobacterium sp. ES2]|uniref:L-histidine N(Alpha)-methyltransferase n=1 Tax=Chryseobacterium metallicongregator TaxID=3073042 RepID=A0ABU1E4X4_9FLAO|nr:MULTISPECIES: L-histidine N(alpha)-methyltransferase [Chryseobacterium]MDR4952800.1 L-histidine N(alpha)-methyltransferase [Chryseobacterium sp. ES2]
MNVQLDPQSKTEENAADHFRSDVLNGLQNTPKKLSSKYFYDKIGDHLFQQIMAMPSYYLTRCELDIFKNKTDELIDLLIPGNEPFDLIELGAGDAMKSTYLLEQLIRKGIDFTYMPIDISGNILSILHKKLSSQLPELKITCLEGDYFEMLQKAASLSDRRKVVLFLGSNIGNMSPEEADDFCLHLNSNLSAKDRVLVGFDLKKNPHIILEAYNDKEGITASFNLNLLTRINNELGGNFDLKQFQHYQTYDPVSGACRSFLISLISQEVTIDHTKISFEENELIDMEISQKFSPEKIRELGEKSGFTITGEIKDAKKWFVDSIWQVK